VVKEKENSPVKPREFGEKSGEILFGETGETGEI